MAIGKSQYLVTSRLSTSIQTDWMPLSCSDTPKRCSLSSAPSAAAFTVTGPFSRETARTSGGAGSGSIRGVAAQPDSPITAANSISHRLAMNHLQWARPVRQSLAGRVNLRVVECCNDACARYRRTSQVLTLPS